jgi:predicted acylesterase/phospholipase RssA
VTLGKIQAWNQYGGAVSAGAYTAGVLDFLTEALEEWETTKAAFKAYLANPAPGPVPPVAPLHDVQIDVFTGASAGGMCAAIASVMVQQPFQHIETGDEQDTTNTFYESWVNKIDISRLLETNDVAGDGPLLSLLDCTIIDEIATYALTPTGATRRPYIADNLNLFLTLTNARGTLYGLYSGATSAEEFVSYYGDRLQFQVTHGASADPPLSPVAKPLPAGQPGRGAWPLLQEAAKATGAVPVALASRVLTRDVADYQTPGWEPLSLSSKQLLPAFPSGIGASIQTVNVDGGVTDNTPFELADNYLAEQLNQASNPPQPDQANAAVLTIAPFPMGGSTFSGPYVPADHQGIWAILMSFFNVTLSQSRFLGESLAALMDGSSFSRFAIAPSDPDSVQKGKPALQCGSLGAFGGFLCRDFRKHDFLLGRRNCQQFLREHFAVTATNPIIDEALTAARAYEARIKTQFLTGCPSPSAALPQGKVWMPLIPLCGKATAEVPLPARATITSAQLDTIVNLIVQRLNAIRPKLAAGELGKLISGTVGILLNWWIIGGKVKKAIRLALENALAGDTASNA